MATVDEALAIPDDNRFSIALNDLLFPRYDRDGFAALTPAEQVAHCVLLLESEVNNGGLDQFFWNSSGDTWRETIAALEAIGAPKFADIVRRAVAAFPGGEPPADRDARCDAMRGLPEAVSQAWFDLDGEFLDYPENLAALLRAYAKAHRAEFRAFG